MKLTIAQEGLRRIAQAVDMSDIGGPDKDLRRQFNGIMETLNEFRSQFDDDYLTELGRTRGEAAASAFVEAVWPALEAVYAYLDLGEE